MLAWNSFVRSSLPNKQWNMYDWFNLSRAHVLALFVFGNESVLTLAMQHHCRILGNHQLISAVSNLLGFVLKWDWTLKWRIILSRKNVQWWTQINFTLKLKLSHYDSIQSDKQLLRNRKNNWFVIVVLPILWTKITRYALLQLRKWTVNEVGPEDSVTVQIEISFIFLPKISRGWRQICSKRT